MPFYHTLGTIPSKEDVYYEQFFGSMGTDKCFSRLYHHQRPTQIKKIKGSYDISPLVAVSNTVKSLQFSTFKLKPSKDYLQSRRALLTNTDCTMYMVSPQESIKEYFYKNADADELIFVHKGSGILRTNLGNIPFSKGDYLYIPQGVVYQFTLDTTENRFFLIESRDPIGIPKAFRSAFGQLLPHAPFCEYNFRRPVSLDGYDKTGVFTVKVKKGDEIFTLTYASHPFDLVGYYGYNYPYAFSVYDISESIAQELFPIFSSNSCSIFNIGASSNTGMFSHISNTASDTVLYHISDTFISRENIFPGAMSFHPSGIVSGPHPGVLGQKACANTKDQLAIAITTKKPLQVTEDALLVANKDYYKTWL